ncbi:MAG: cytochrome B [Gammaproteobacteria bacterium]|nr:cytochrome B [Gammaproteobacteria bacterium]
MNGESLVKVWDPVVRFFHWSMLSAFTVAYFTDDDLLTPHVYAGYLILGLLVIRLLWGVVGSRYARFSNFVRSPAVVIAYLKDVAAFRATRYLGHNPAGGAMIIALLVSLFAITLSGIALYGIEESAGPLAGAMANVDPFWEDVLEELHEFFANFTVALVVVHVAGVLLAGRQHGENLVRSMLNGYKRASLPEHSKR